MRVKCNDHSSYPSHIFRALHFNYVMTSSVLLNDFFLLFYFVIISWQKEYFFSDSPISYFVSVFTFSHLFCHD